MASFLRFRRGNFALTRYWQAATIPRLRSAWGMRRARAVSFEVRFSMVLGRNADPYDQLGRGDWFTRQGMIGKRRSARR